MTKKTDSPIAAKKSMKDGHVGIRATLRCNGWGADHARIDAGTDLTVAQARDLARALIDLADVAEALLAKKVATTARRKAWREREIEAGRMLMIGLRP